MSHLFSIRLLPNIFLKIKYALFYRFKDGYILDMLTNLLSRTQPTFIQLCASRALTYIYRCGALSSTDDKILYKAMPCLVRLCSKEFDESTRSAAANYLSYLCEVIFIIIFSSLLDIPTDAKLYILG